VSPFGPPERLHGNVEAQHKEQSSFIEQKIQPIRCLKPIVLGLRQGQLA
jgi:hypothetical protein